MGEPPKSRRPEPPHNPCVRDLVEGKRQWSARVKNSAARKGFRGWHERGYLPHRDEPGLTQFVTFHLTDSFPNSLRSEWAHFAKVEDDQQRRRLIEAYLDKGRGECHLKRADIARIVEDNFREYSGNRYTLRAWVIMPNHVHVMFRVGSVSMAETVGAWKSNTGKIANRILGRRGEFWAEDYFDIYMRDEAHELKVVRYIEDNPPKAKLVLDPKEWPWSSARFRDKYGVLKIQGGS